MGANPSKGPSAKGDALKPGAAKEANPNEQDVYDALRTEFDPDAGDRGTLLNGVLQRDPDFAPAHWAKGEVWHKERWVDYEAVPQDAKGNAAWNAYREFRRHSDASASTQQKLADYCRKNKLAEQERGHLRAVIVADRDNMTAHKRLGEVNVDGEWLSKPDLEERRAHSRAVADALKKCKAPLTRLSQQLKSGAISHADAVQELKRYSDPMFFPSLELYVSTPDPTGALAVIEALSFLWDAEASLSLARHAMAHPVEMVRDAAVDVLRQRDFHGFIPQLLASLQSPVLTREALANHNGTLVWRQVFYVDKQDSQQLAVLDRVFHLEGDISSAGTVAYGAVRNESDFRNRSLDQINQGIAASNEKVSDLLKKVTGKHALRTPDDWWTWWSDENESVVLDGKPHRVRRSVSHSNVCRVPEIPAAGSERVLSSRPTLSCLAPGTEIWTDAGPVAVELIRTGDLVLSQHPETGELAYKAVVRPTERPPANLLRITLGDETIRATGGHSFWISGYGWVTARKLRKGFLMHTATGVKAVDEVKDEETLTKAFNLVVDDFHTYFVGKTRLYSYDNTARLPALVPVPGLTE